MAGKISAFFKPAAEEREPKLAKKYYAEIDESLQRIGLKFKDFTLTDNSCRVAETKLEELEADLVFVETKVASGLASTERGFVKELSKDVVSLETGIAKGARAVVREAAKDLEAVEQEAVRDEQQLEGFFKGLLSPKR